VSGAQEDKSHVSLSVAVIGLRRPREQSSASGRTCCVCGGCGCGGSGGSDGDSFRGSVVA
jgi:hypothetical protein